MKRQEVRPRTFLRPGHLGWSTAPSSRAPRTRSSGQVSAAQTERRQLVRRPPARPSIGGRLAHDQAAAETQQWGRALRRHQGRSEAAGHDRVLGLPPVGIVAEHLGPLATHLDPIGETQPADDPVQPVGAADAGVDQCQSSVGQRPAPARARGHRRRSRDRRTRPAPPRAGSSAGRTRPRGGRPPRAPGPGRGTPAAGLRRARPAAATNLPVPVRAWAPAPSPRRSGTRPAQASAPGRITTRR